MWLAAAAVVLIAIGGWLWVRNRPSEQTTAVVVLDLRGRATVRGETPTDANQQPLEITRGARHIHVDLPVGSTEGTYELAVLNGNSAELFHSTGTAKFENHILVLRAEVDLASVSPGSYFLGLRQQGTEWTRFPIRVL